MSVKVDKESPCLMMFKTHHDLIYIYIYIYIKGYFHRMGREDVNTLDVCSVSEERAPSFFTALHEEIL